MGPAEALDLTGLLRDVTDPMLVLQRIVAEALVLIPEADGAVIELVRDAHLEYVCAAGSLSEFVGMRLSLDGSLSGHAVTAGQTLYSADASSDPRVDPDACRLIRARSMACVPLQREGEPLGVLKVTSSLADGFGASALWSLTKLGEFISVLIRSAFDVARIAAELSLPGTDPAAHALDDVASARLELTPESNRLTEFVANIVSPGRIAAARVRHGIEGIIARSRFGIVCQPIIDLDTESIVGAEALTRFRVIPEKPPDAWFQQAHASGLGIRLELAVVDAALEVVKELPADAYLAINVGPDTVQDGSLPALLEPLAKRVVLELTEHVKVADYLALRAALDAVRARGARLAVDDAGAGFASLAHIVHLAPDIIKLDRDITHHIDEDPVRRALASALVAFAADTRAEVVAEGIETSGELETVRRLGIHRGQGYLLGRPEPVAVLRTAAAAPAARCA